MSSIDSIRHPTFISFTSESTGRRSRPNSAKKSRSCEVVPEKKDSSCSLTYLGEDIDEFISSLIDKVLKKIVNDRVSSPTSDDDRPFISPILSNSREKTDEFYTPRSEVGDAIDDLPKDVAQDDFEITDEAGCGDSLEFVMKDIPIQEDPESPVKYNLSDQLLAEIDETLNSILNLDESPDLGISVDSVENVDSEPESDDDYSILIEYADNPLEEIIADYNEYYKEYSQDIKTNYDTSAEVCQEIVHDAAKEEHPIKNENVEIIETNDKEEYPMTADIEDTFNALLSMTEKEGSNVSHDSDYFRKFSLSPDASEDIYLRASISDLEEVPGTDLHRSLKTPDATKAEELVNGEVPDTTGCISSEDEIDEQGFVIMNDREIKESVLYYEKFKDRVQNEKKSSNLVDMEVVVVEMEEKGPLEVLKSEEERPFRQSPPVRRRSRASNFFRRAVSVFNVWKTRSWTPKDDAYRVKDDNMEIVTTSFGGEPVDITKTATLPLERESKPIDAEMPELFIQGVQIRAPTRLPNKKILSRLSGTQSLPSRSSGKRWSFFKINR